MRRRQVRPLVSNYFGRKTKVSEEKRWHMAIICFGPLSLASYADGRTDGRACKRSFWGGRYSLGKFTEPFWSDLWRRTHAKRWAQTSMSFSSLSVLFAIAFRSCTNEKCVNNHWRLYLKQWSMCPYCAFGHHWINLSVCMCVSGCQCTGYAPLSLRTHNINFHWTSNCPDRFSKYPYIANFALGYLVMTSLTWPNQLSLLPVMCNATQFQKYKVARQLDSQELLFYCSVCVSDNIVILAFS
jgi:hypothetical protein